MICSHGIDNKIVSCHVRRDGLLTFAALVLERAAQEGDAMADDPVCSRKENFTAGFIDGCKRLSIRLCAMAEGLKP